MSAFKATKRASNVQNNTNAGTGAFKATKYKGFDETMVYDWETTNKQSLDILNDYNNRINKSEWLDEEERKKYRSALDSYIETSNYLRDINKMFGEGYTAEDEKKWADSIASMNKGYDEISKYYGKFTNDTEYNHWYSKETKRQEFEATKTAEDFGIYSQEGAKVANPSWKDAHAPFEIFGWQPFGDGEDIGNMVTFAEANGMEALKVSGVMNGGGGVSPYDELVLLINQFMEDDEKAIYNYYIGKGDTEKANEYLTYITDILRQRQAGKIADQADDHLLLEPITSGLAGMQTGIQGIGNFVSGIAGTEGAPTSSLQYAHGIMSQGVEGDPERQGNKGVWKAVNDLAYTAGNMAPSIGAGALAAIVAGPAVGKAVGSIVTGISSAGNSYANMIAEGYGVDQARKYGTMVGAAEGGLSYLLSGISKTGGKITSNLISKAIDGIDNGIARFFVDFMISSSSESLEEGAQAVLDPIFKMIATGEDFEGIDWSEVGYSAMLGGLSAGLLEGVPNAAGALHANYKTSVANGGLSMMGAIKAFADTKSIKGVAEAYKAGKQNVTNSANTAVNNALEAAPDNAYAQRMKSRLDNGKNASGYQLNRLAETHENALVSQDKGKMKAAAEARLTELGESGDVSKLADVIVKAQSGEKLTSSERATLVNSKYGRRVSTELNPKSIESGNYTSEWAENIGTERINTEAYNRGVLKSMSAENSLTTVRENVEAELTKLGEGENASAIAVAMVKKAAGVELSEEESQLIDNSEYASKVEQSFDLGGAVAEAMKTEAVTENATVEENATEGKMEGSEAISENTVDSPATVEESAVTLEDASTKYGAQAQAMVHTYVEGQDVAQYDKAYQIAYDMGKSGVALSYAMNSEAASYLTEQQRQLAYEAGRSAADISAKEQEAKIKSAATGKTGRKIGTVKGEGVTISDLKKTFNDTQNRGYKILSTFAEATGIDIVLYKSEANANGDFEGAQGRFKWADDKIYIDINAGLKNVKSADDLAKYAMLRTFSHEFTHFIEKYNPVWYNEFRKVVFEELTTRGENVNDLIETKMAQNKGMSYEKASREVVAEAMTDILPDSHFVETLANNHKNIFEKLLAKLKEFLVDLKAYFNSIGHNRSREANTLKEQVGEAVHYVENIVKLFDKVAIEAVENYQATVAFDEAVEAPAKVETKPAKKESSEKTLFEKYDAIKQKYPDNIVLYRVGDFFEVLGEDAKAVSEWTDTTLTGRNDPNSGRVSMVGFPAHKIEAIVEKIRTHQGVTLAQEENGVVKEYPMAPLESSKPKATMSEIDSEGNPIYETLENRKPIEPVNFKLLEKTRKQADEKYGISESQSKVLKSYVMTAKIINGKMRSGNISEQDASYIKELTEALKKFPAFEGRTYRNLKFTNEQSYNAFIEEHTQNSIFTEDAFTSTSKKPNAYPLFGKYVVHMVFDGVSGRDIADTYGLPRQQEVLFLPGTKYKVESVSIANDGNPIIFVKEIANNEVQDNDGNLGGREPKLGRDDGLDVSVSRRERDVDRGVYGDGRRNGNLEEELRDPDRVSGEPANGTSLRAEVKSSEGVGEYADDYDLYRAHQSSVRAARERLSSDKGKIEVLERKIELGKSDMLAIKDTYSESKFSITVGKQKFTDKKDAGAALMAEALAKAVDTSYVSIGSFAGFDVRVIKTPEGIKGAIVGKQGYPFNTYPNNTTYMINHLVSVVEGITESVNAWRAALEEIKKDMAEQEKLIGEPFAKQAELDEKRKRYNEVMEILNPKEEQSLDSVAEDTVQEQSRDYLDDDYSTDGVHWGVEAGIMSNADARAVWEAIANIEKRGFKGYPKTVDGDYFVESETTLMILGSDYRHPVVKTIFKFKDNESYAKEAIIGARGIEQEVREAESFIEVLFGKGYIVRYDFQDSQAYGWQNGRGKGSDSRQSSERPAIREWIFEEQEQQRTDTLTDREVLEMASNEIKVSDLNQAERDALTIFQDRLSNLKDLQDKRAEQGRLYKEQQFGVKPDRTEAEKTLNRMHTLDEQIKKATADVLTVEEKEVLKRVLTKARKVVEVQERQRGQEILQRWRDRRNNAVAIKKYRDRLRGDVDELTNWIISPDNKDIAKHVPDVLKNSVIPFLSSINFMSKRSLKGGDATVSDKEFIKRLDALQSAIKINIDVYGMYSGYNDLPPNFMESLENFRKSAQSLLDKSEGEFIINQMTSDELKELSKVVRTLKKYIMQINRFHNNAMYQHVYEAGDESIDSLKELDNASDKTGAVSNFLFWQQIRPAYAFERFGEGGKAIYDGLRQGQAKLAFNTKEIVNFTKKAYTEKEVRSWEDEIKTFSLGNDLVKIPVSHLMSFYELNKDPEAKEHIDGGGIRVATYTRKGKKISDIGHILTVGEFNQLIGSLTDRQKEVADSLQKYMAEQGGKWGNYVSVARFGEELFTNKKYFPINSDGRHLSATVDEHPSAAALYALLNMSFTKSRKEGANNRIVLYSIFDVFANHMASMAQYNAMALPILDALKWFNYQQVVINDDGEKFVTGNLREQMARVYGVPEETKPGSGKQGYAETFIVNIIKAFNGTAAQGTPYDTLGLKSLRRYNMAQVAYNFRVALQQPLAITRAGLLVDYKSVIKGMKLNPSAIKKNIEEMQAHSGIAAWKSLGFYDVNISRGLTQVIKHDTGALDKIGNVGMWGAEKADTLTWAAIWSAAKEEVISKQHLTPSSEGFYEAVTKLFEDIIYKTQVVDSVLTKNEFMRDKGAFARLVGSFMSEATTNASMLLDAYDKYNLDIKRGMTSRQAWQKNGGKIGRTLYVYGVGAILLAAVQAVADAFRDDDEYEEWGEKWVEAFTGNLVDEIMPFNKLPIVSDFYDLAKELLSIFGVDTYGNPPQSVFMQWYDSLVKGTEIIYNKIAGENTNYTWYGGIYKLLQAASGISGLPLGSVSRELITAWNNTIGAMAPSLRVVTYEATQAETRDALYEAIISGDERERKRIEAEYANQNEIDAALRKALRENDSRIKEAAEAFMKGDYNKYNSLREEIISEGHFSRKIVTDALKAEYNYLKKKAEEDK